MRFPTSRLRPLVGAVAAAVVLTACGGGGDSDDGDKAAAKDDGVSQADFTEAKKALADLKADYQAAYEAGAEVQKTSVAYFKSNPAGSAEDAEMEAVTTKLDEAVDTRAAALEEVEDLDALEDPEVAEAFETFNTKAEKGDAFHDTLFATFPLLQQAFASCGQVFSAAKVEGTPTSAADMGRTMLAQSQPVVAKCLPVLEKLRESANANVAAFGEGFIAIVEDRRTLMTRLSKDDIGMDAFSSQYKKVSGRVSTVGKNIDFQKQLTDLSPVPEFLALEKVVDGKIT